MTTDFRSGAPSGTTDRLRVLILSDTSSYMRGGVPAETRLLIRGLSRNGHTVALLADAPLQGVESIEHFPLAAPLGEGLAAALRQALDTFRPDVVHVMSISSRGHLQLPALLSGRHWIVTIHSVAPYERKLNVGHRVEWLHYGLRWLRFLPNTLMWRWALRTADVPCIVVHSRFVEEAVLRYGAPQGGVRVVPLGFDAPDPTRRIGRHAAPVARGETLRLLTIGGIVHTKGQHDIVRALPMLRRRIPDVQALFIGEIRDQTYAAELIELAKRLGVADSVRIASEVGHAEKAKALADASIYVQPSHEEGFCLAYAEAAVDVPRLVGADAGAIAAISAGDPGARVVAPRNPGALADAILELANAALPADLFEQRSRRLLERFSIAGYVAAHETLYRAGRR